MELTWTHNAFYKLGPGDIYDILKLRSEVFVVEQNCVYLDADDKDQQAFHLCGYSGAKLIAYARLLPPGVSYEGKSSIGRVVTSPSFRKSGAGKILMQKAIDITLSLFPKTPIKIGAQLYLLDFYSSFGFQSIGEPYLEDGIPHIEMVLEK